MAGKVRKGRRAVRWIFGVAVLVIAVSVLAAVAVPLAVSSELVRDRLERDISQWTGQYVALGTHPDISFWPVPSITFNNVTIMPRDAGQSKPLALADSVTAEFNVISALTGKPEFTDFRFVKPLFRLERQPDGSLNWQTGQGHIAEASRIAAGNAAADGKSKPGSKPIPDYRLGRITISDGRVQFIDKRNDDIESIEKLNGTIDWGVLASAAQIDLSGTFRGKTVHLAASSDKPLLLLAGVNAPVSLTLDSAPLSLSFSGSATCSRRPFFKGKLVLGTGSVGKVLQWADTDIRPGEAIGKLHIDADLTTQPDRINLDNLIIDIDDNRGIGVLDIQMPKAHFPVVAGTLAFNKLNITSFLKAFTPLPKPGENIATTIDTRFLRQLGLDLRLSAQSAKLGGLSLANVAAAARIDEGRATFDIGDASAYGGSLMGRIQISEKGLDGGGVVQLSARQVDFGSVFDALKMKGPLPRGKGSLTMQLRSSRPIWATSDRDITGNLKLSIKKGKIPSFDIDTFRQLGRKKRFFDLGEASSGSLPFVSASFAAEFSDGLAQINKGTITTADSVIGLSGVVPYAKGSLAMAGSLAPKPEKKAAGKKDVADPITPNPEPSLRFFIGGSWPSPVISPVLSQ